MSATAENILERLAAIQNDLLDVKRVSSLLLTPEPIRVYKPSHKDLSGTALKLDLRLEPVYEKNYIKEVSGGLFLEVVPQKTMKTKEKDAEFAWTDPKAITAKLGLPDITTWLVAMQCRQLRKPIPQRFRAKGDEVGNTISLFHKFEGDEGGSSTTVIEYKLEKESGSLSLSKGKDHRRYIAIDLAEEMRVRCYLEHALTTFQLVGKR